MDTKVNLQFTFFSSNHRPIVNSGRFSRSDFHGTPSNCSALDTTKFIRHDIDKRYPCWALTNREIFKKLDKHWHNGNPKNCWFRGPIIFIDNKDTRENIHQCNLNHKLDKLTPATNLNNILPPKRVTVPPPIHRIFYKKTKISSMILLLTLRNIILISMTNQILIRLLKIAMKMYIKILNLH